MRFRLDAKQVCFAIVIVLGFAQEAFAQTDTGTLRGQVTDPSGAAVAGANVVVTPAIGAPLTAATNRDGAYEFKNLPPGVYTLRIAARGFAVFEIEDIQIVAAQIQNMDAALQIAEQQQKVVVEGEASTVDVNPENNVGAIVLKGKDLEALSDDPDELMSDLQALAGPSAGPNGGQIYIDGFTAGQLPPKSAIREIRINQNPYSAEYDKLGYGRIEIFTKPGTDQWHGNIQVQGNDSSFNSQNPFAHGAEPPYYSTLFNGNIGGPLSKKASLFFGAQYRDIHDIGVIDADSPNTSENNASIPQPRTRWNLAPRVDYQLNKDNTLSIRYQYYRDNQENQGLTGFQLATQAYNVLNAEQTLQVTDTQVFNANLLNETRFQYLRDATNQVASSPLPSVIVPGAFVGGGNNLQNVADLANHYELQNYTQWVHGHHTVKFGVRLRETTDTDNINSGFNGSYFFSSLNEFAAGTPAQFTITTGSPHVYATEFDSGWYAQDDWRIRPNITLSAGLRLEQQTDIPDHLDWAPRFAIAWGLGHSKTAPKTVLRAGTGLFYDRFTENLVLQAERLNGITQTQTVVANPCFFQPNTVLTVIPTCTGAQTQTTLPTRYQISNRLHAPGTLQTAVTLERQATKSLSLSFSYLNSRGFYQLLTNNINTPDLGTFCLAPAVCNPVYPLGVPGNVYEFESEAVYRQNQLITQANYRLGSRVSLRGYYVLNYAKSDTAGPTSFPSNPFDISEDYGRASFDNRQRVFAGGSINLPHGFSVFPFLLFVSGGPYSITLSQDLVGSSQFNQRPAFVSSASPAADVVATKFGSFDTIPQPGETIVPINSLTAPPHFSLNLRLSKTWGFGGETTSSGAGTTGGGPSGGGGRGGGGGGTRGGFGMPGGFGGGSTTSRRYNLTLGISARNVFNYENVAIPSGVIDPPDAPGGTASVPSFFGKPNALAGGAFSSTSASRLVYLQLGFSF